MTLAAMAALAATQASWAATPLKVESVRFKAKLSGSQVTNWTLNRTDSCGSEAGSGSQSAKFQQKPKHVVLVFSRYLNHDGPLLPVRVVGKTGGIPIKGTYTRSGKQVMTPNGECYGTKEPGGTPITPPPSDCGTSAVSGAFQFSWHRPQEFPTLPGYPTPLVPTLFAQEPIVNLPFRNCAWNGPLVLFRHTRLALPLKKAFTAKKLKLHDTVERVDVPPTVGPGVRAESTVSLTLKLTRLGK